MKLSTHLGELPSFQVACFAINKHEKAGVKGPEVQKEEERREKRS